MYARYGSMNDLSSMFESNNESNNDNECCTSTPSHGGVPTSFGTFLPPKSICPIRILGAERRRRQHPYAICIPTRSIRSTHH
jgi:hypothetical protein